MHASDAQPATPLTRHSLLMRITRNGDDGSWDEFFSIYHPYVHRVLRRWRIPDHEACEIAQEVFLILLHALPRFAYRPRPGRFRCWLKRIVHNAAIDHLRRSTRVREVSLGIDPGTRDARSPSGQMDDEERLPMLTRAMHDIRARANPVTWRCFEEHLLNERTAAEVGNELNVSPNAVYVNTSRILAQLRRQCAQSARQTGDAAARDAGRCAPGVPPRRPG
jgi:RNA polymerase sigma-70 factor (ECF subfamily)